MEGIREADRTAEAERDFRELVGEEVEGYRETEK